MAETRRLRTDHLENVPFTTFPFRSEKGNTARIARDIAEAKTGDHVELWRGEYLGSCEFPRWRSHPRGFVLRLDDRNRFLLNGETLIADTSRCGVDWEAMEAGVVHSEQSIAAPPNGSCRLMLNGTRTLFEDRESYEIGHLHSHPLGVLTVRNLLFDSSQQAYLLNGELLYSGETNGWQVHPEGVVVKIGDRLMLNGKRELGRTACEHWHVTEHGLFTWSGNQVQLNGEYFCDLLGWKRPVIHGDNFVTECEGQYVALNGRRLLMAGDAFYMRWHLHGVVVATNFSLTLIVVKPEKPFNPDVVLCK